MINKTTNKKVIILLLLFIPLVSAISLYGGESTQIQLDKEFSYYSMVGNTTEVILNVIQDENYLVTITLNKYSESDNFELVFFDKDKEIITQYVSSGGGGSSKTKTIYKNITEYVNKTEYIDREVIKEVEKEVPVENIKEVIINNKFWLYFSIMLTIIFILVVISYFIIKKETDDFIPMDVISETETFKTDERRLEDNE